METSLGFGQYSLEHHNENSTSFWRFVPDPTGAGRGVVYMGEVSGAPTSDRHRIAVGPDIPGDYISRVTLEFIGCVC